MRDYEVLVQSFALPQFSFVPNTPTPTAGIQFPVAQPAAAPLSGIDIVFVVDDSDSVSYCSGSMNWIELIINRPILQMEGDRWSDVHSALSGVAHDCGQFDEDGFDLYFLNNEYFQQSISVSLEHLHCDAYIHWLPTSTE